MFYFVANLKPYTLSRLPGQHPFDAYLLSVDYADEYRELAARARTADRLLCADNGNFDVIGAYIEELRDRVDELHEVRRIEEEALGHYARPGELSRELTDRYRDLADYIEDNIRAVDPGGAIRTQQALSPTYLVGPEELAIPVINGLGMQPEYMNLPLAWYSDLTAELLEETAALQADPANAGPGLVFQALHAFDYDTAYVAGRLAGEVEAEGLACGLGAALADRTWIDYRVRDGNIVPLAKAIPRPYLRVLDVAAGLHAGYAAETGRRPRFHALGVGSPILLILLSLLGDPGTFTATDSTAPIKDAASSSTITLYATRPAPLKLKAHRVIEVWLSEGIPWACSCAACRSFPPVTPATLADARRWWRAEGERELQPEDLRPPSPLADWFPLLGTAEDPDQRRAAVAARINHNHTQLKSIEASIRRYTNQGSLRAWVARVVEAYSASGADPDWVDAVNVAWTVADDCAATLEDALPGGDLDG
jgi:hypothetical protein